jgi:hypothetical protein
MANLGRIRRKCGEPLPSDRDQAGGDHPRREACDRLPPSLGGMIGREEAFTGRKLTSYGETFYVRKN